MDRWDKLDLIFARQEALDRFLTETRGLSFDLSTWLEKEVLALLAELGELLHELNFRWWKNPHPLDREAIKEELVDLLHFLVSMCLKLEIGPQELFEAYLAKNEENFRRQQGLSSKPGYSPPSA
ncbi:MAG: dUTPase [Moorellales bacterium]